MNHVWNNLDGSYLDEISLNNDNDDEDDDEGDDNNRGVDEG